MTAKMPEDIYGVLTCLNMMDYVVRVEEGSFKDMPINIYLNVPFIRKYELEMLCKVGSVLGIYAVEDEMVAIACSK